MPRHQTPHPRSQVPSHSKNQAPRQVKRSPATNPKKQKQPSSHNSVKQAAPHRKPEPVRSKTNDNENKRNNPAVSHQRVVNTSPQSKAPVKVKQPEKEPIRFNQSKEEPEKAIPQVARKVEQAAESHQPNENQESRGIESKDSDNIDKQQNPDETDKPDGSEKAQAEAGQSNQNDESKPEAVANLESVGTEETQKEEKPAETNETNEVSDAQAQNQSEIESPTESKQADEVQSQEKTDVETTAPSSESELTKESGEASEINKISESENTQETSSLQPEKIESSEEAGQTELEETQSENNSTETEKSSNDSENRPVYHYDDNETYYNEAPAPTDYDENNEPIDYDESQSPDEKENEPLSKPDQEVEGNVQNADQQPQQIESATTVEATANQENIGQNDGVSPIAEETQQVDYQADEASQKQSDDIKTTASVPQTNELATGSTNDETKKEENKLQSQDESGQTILSNESQQPQGDIPINGQSSNIQPSEEQKESNLSTDVQNNGSDKTDLNQLQQQNGEQTNKISEVIMKDATSQISVHNPNDKNPLPEPNQQQSNEDYQQNSVEKPELDNDEYENDEQDNDQEYDDDIPNDAPTE